MTSTSGRRAASRAAAGPTARRLRTEHRPAHSPGSRVGHAAGTPHHARNVSMSRNTRAASARSASSSASVAASARSASPARARAAAISAERTAEDTGVPSAVRAASALVVSSSGRKVMVSAMPHTVTPDVRHDLLSWVVAGQQASGPAAEPNVDGHRRRTSRPVSRVLSCAGAHGRPSIYGCRCRQPQAVYPGARAGTLERSLSDLAPGGVCRADRVTPAAGGLLHRRFTLTGTIRRRARRSVLCGTFPRVTPGGCYPPPCPVEPGLSSAGSLLTRPSGRLVRRT